jgi:hypothetical protein
MVCAWFESINVVGSAFPFHRICDWRAKPLPDTISTVESASCGMDSGESEAIWGCVTPGQLTKIAVQVHPDNSKVRAPTKARRTQAEGLPDPARGDCTRTSLFKASNILHPKQRHGRGVSGRRERCPPNLLSAITLKIPAASESPLGEADVQIGATRGHRSRDGGEPSHGIFGRRIR